MSSPPPQWQRGDVAEARQVMDGRGGRPLWPMVRFMVATTLIMIPLGGIQSWSRLKQVVSAYLGWKAGAAGHERTGGDVMDVNVVAWFSFGVSMLFFGRLMEEMRNPKFVVMIGAVIGGAGLILASLCTSLVGFIFCYGVLLGAACGTYIVPLFYVAKCFPHTSGVLMGFASACFASGELVQNVITAVLLRLDEMPGEDDVVEYEVYKRLPFALRLLALYYASALFAGAVCLPDPKEVMLRVQFEAQYHLLQRGRPRSQTLTGSTNDPAFDGPNAAEENTRTGLRHVRDLVEKLCCGQGGIYTGYPLVREWWFWLLPVMTFCTYVSGTLVTQNYSDIRLQVVASTAEDDTFDAEIWARVASIAGRLIWGMVSDAAGYHYALMGVSVTSGAFCLSYPFVRNNGLFHMWSAIIFFAWSGNPAIVPAFVSEMLGGNEFSVYYPLVALGACFGIGVGYAVSDSFVDTLGTPTLVVMAALMGLSNIAIFPVRYFRTPSEEQQITSGKWPSGSQEQVSNKDRQSEQTQSGGIENQNSGAMQRGHARSNSSSSQQFDFPPAGGVSDLNRQFSRPIPDVFRTEVCRHKGRVVQPFQSKNTKF